jgi:hypothetical protein
VIVIDAIDEPNPRGKAVIFAELVNRHCLGMTTVQILRPGVPACHTATYTVANLNELKTLVTDRLSALGQGLGHWQ